MEQEKCFPVATPTRPHLLMVALPMGQAFKHMSLLGPNLSKPLWKSIWWFLRKLGIDVPRDLDIPFLGIYPKDAPSYHKDTCSTMVIVALFIIARN